jgi:hypothetical protein
MRFAPRPVRFGHRPDEDEEGSDLPAPARVRLQVRRAAGIAEARQVLEHLPEPGESLHAVVTARLDLTDVINAILEKLGRCDRMMIATLGYNARNLRMILEWLDTGAVQSLSLVASIFYRSHNGSEWQRTLDELRARGQRAACCHSHAKVVTLAFATGERFSIEGSANLCGNGSGREQFALVNDAGLHDFHATWISQLVNRHEAHESDAPATP